MFGQINIGHIAILIEKVSQLLLSEIISYVHIYAVLSYAPTHCDQLLVYSSCHTVRHKAAAAHRTRQAPQHPPLCVANSVSETCRSTRNNLSTHQRASAYSCKPQAVQVGKAFNDPQRQIPGKIKSEPGRMSLFIVLKSWREVCVSSIMNCNYHSVISRIWNTLTSQMT